MRSSKLRWATSFVVALTLLLVMLPLLVFIAIAVAVVDGRPILFRSRRIGRGGTSFLMYKFRTMSNAQNGEAFHLITTAHDARVTTLGRTLRRFRLDEWPQLLNILKGEMVVVGPRPESPEYAAVYHLESMAILELMPGLTDPGTIAFLYDETAIVSAAIDPSNAYVQHVMPARNALSLSYARSATAWSDLLVLAATAVVIAVPPLARSIGRYLAKRKLP